MSTAAKTTYSCGCCGRALRRRKGEPHWIYSTFTGARYCWPGEGCNRSKPNGSRRSRPA